MALSIIAIYEFGPAMHHTLLKNIEEQTGIGSSYFIRGTYMLGLVCHIPFVFFAGKESFLILIEETWNKTLSKHIE